MDGREDGSNQSTRKVKVLQGIGFTQQGNGMLIQMIKVICFLLLFFSLHFIVSSLEEKCLILDNSLLSRKSSLVDKQFLELKPSGSHYSCPIFSLRYKIRSLRLTIFLEPIPGQSTSTLD